MTAPAFERDEVRHEAARLAFTVIRYESGAAHPLQRQDPDLYSFLPSWRQIPAGEVEKFLIGLPSPALFYHTTIRQTVAMLLLNELSGDRRKWGEKTLSNFTSCFDTGCEQLGLSAQTRFLLECNGETLVFSHAAVRYWTAQFGSPSGWNVAPLRGDPRADARLVLRRGDGMWTQHALPELSTDPRP
jgi:hypothetical protein